MKFLYFTPGPSQVYPSVPRHIRTALRKDILSLSHRSSTFKGIFAETQEGIKALLSVPDNYTVVFVSSGTEAMERIIQNLVKYRSHHIITGEFGKKFAEIARQLHKTVSTETLDHSHPISDQKSYPELLCFTHTDTSNGYTLPSSVIAIYKKKYPQALIALDIVSSVPIIELDYSLLDSVFFSVQKGFGIPAGLGVLILSPRALEKAARMREEGISTGSYHDFPTLVKHAQSLQTPETPNILALYLLSRVLKDMQKMGKTELFAQSKQKAELLHSFFTATSKFDMIVTDPKARSQTVLVARTPHAREVVKALYKRGLVIGEGYGKEKDTQIRIANFPAHSVEDVGQLVSTLSLF